MRATARVRIRCLQGIVGPAAVRDVQAIVQPLVEKNGNTLVVTCPNDIGEMHADQTKLRQTFFNLLSNRPSSPATAR
jgi:C4-dicarboxylate-specific signal transduction histidine kinase